MNGKFIRGKLFLCPRYGELCRYAVILLICILLTAALSACSSGAGSFRETRELKLSADGIESMEITAGAGSLDITPSEEGKEILVYAEIVSGAAEEEAAKSRIAKELLLSLKRKGNRAVLESTFQGMFSFIGVHQGRAVNLDIRVPKGIEISVVNSDGEVHIAGVENPLVIENSGLELVLEGTKGEVRIRNEKGNARIEDLEGDVVFHDGGGNLIIEEVRGEVTIVDKGGDIKAAAVSGNMTIEDTNGAVMVEKLSGDLRVTGAGKGDCVYTDVKGDIRQND